MPNSASKIKSSGRYIIAGANMPLDSRLSLLKDAIKEDWIELDAYEKENELVIRLRNESPSRRNNSKYAFPSPI